jgi:SAM-dependent methyltransferase
MARFDSVAPRYDAFCHTAVGRFVDTIERQLLLDVLRPRTGERIIDLGCGTGAYSVTLADLHCDVVGVDESAAMLAIARTKPTRRGQVMYIQADLADLPYRAGAFDAGLLQVTLEFVSHPDRVLREAFRVLNASGRLVIGLIHGTGPWARHYRARAARDARSVYAGAHFWTVPDLENLLGARPVAVSGGLYVGPDEFHAETDAWPLEIQRRATRPLDEAGFIVVRYDRTQVSWS